VKARAIDANIILRFLLADHPKQSLRCRTLMARVEDNQEEIYLPEVALCDVVWTLKSFYKWPTDKIRRFVLTLLSLNGVRMRRKGLVQNAILLFADHNIDFSDALIAAEVLERETTEIYTYDRDFRRIAGIIRLEP